MRSSRLLFLHLNRCQKSQVGNKTQSRCYHYKENIFGFSNVSPLKTPELKFPDTDRSLNDVIEGFRRFGYRAADLNPLGFDKSGNKNVLRSLLKTLTTEEPIFYQGFNGSAAELIDHLENLYCGRIGIEFSHLHSIDEQNWLAHEFETLKKHEFDVDQKKKIAELLIYALTFEKFLETKIPTLKRYSGEGSEASVPFHWHIFENAPLYEIKDIVWGGAHRGRSGLHVILFGLDPEMIFRKIRGMSEFPDDVQGSGDVLSHLNCHYDYKSKNGTVHLSTVPNPSHLEVSGPVANGKARGRSRTLNVGDYAGGRVGDSVLAMHYHGDGAFTGQGSVWEQLNAMNVPHFRIGGSVHLIVNNQIAFTAEPAIGRSSLNCTDFAKAIDCPVIHVNANSPEDVVRAADLAIRYRQEYRKDIFVNLISFRRHGHNELDNPRFTNPLMYEIVDAQPSIADIYAKELELSGILNAEFSNECKQKFVDRLSNALKSVDEGKTTPTADHLKGYWSGFVQAPKAVTKYDTGFSIDALKFIGAASVRVKDGFVSEVKYAQLSCLQTLHPHLEKMHVNARLKQLEAGENINWGTAEAMAIGSLLVQGYDCRICGQDVGRSTFSFRHGILVDQKTDEVYVPLNHINPEQRGFLELANSPLSEEAILAFEYGLSIENPKRLVMWEAQFGDFYNSAQVPIDQLIATGESKWLTQSGLVLLLPHGFDGAGPDHSSAHVERFLQLTDSREDQKPVDGDNVNMHVVNPTTSAQYFHLLRRQMLTPFRKPLILIAPKLILRHPMAASSLSDFSTGTYFHPVLSDAKVKDNDKIETIVFVSGKHALHLMSEREKRDLNNVAIVRLERLCPFPVEELRNSLEVYKNAKKFIWSQEEPRNAGCWSFVKPRFENALGITLKYVGRPEISWFATSIGQHHEAEAKKVAEETFI
ncbi:putative 2-oxoglutarate dehydrogenase E1 component DHKTD1-like protein, mitochondrial [Aphelenchoides besseyi]|nr:putative 2-oxoglutarate dehydrogenase E1 component DHKTD1-like protein, mitochondrial [Aphelenchoides besseyi]